MKLVGILAAMLILTSCGNQTQTKVYTVREPFEYRMITTSKNPIEVTDEIYRICKGNVASISVLNKDVTYAIIDFRCGV